jgi:phage shock protein A
MAKQMGNEQLAQQALDKKRQYENALARLQEFEIEK